MARLHEHWANLPKHPVTGKVIKKDFDFPTRLGMCHAPISQRDLQCYTVTHKLIHAMDFCVRILIHLRIKHFDWFQYQEVQEDVKVKYNFKFCLFFGS